MSRQSSETYRQIWKDSSLMRLMILTFLGMAIQTVVIQATYGVEIRNSIRTGIVNLSTPDYFYYLVINIGVAFGYCLITSISFYPKRIVSPYSITIGASAIMIIYLVAPLPPDASVPIDRQPSIIFAVVVTYFMVMSMISWILSLPFPRIVGLNGTYEDLEIDNFSLTVDYDTVKSVLTERYFRRDYDLSIEENENDLVLLKTPNRTDVRITIALVPPDKKHPHPIIAIVGYEVKYDSFVRTKAVQRRIRGLKNDILGEIRQEHPTAIETKIDCENEALLGAIDKALAVTASPIKQISRRVIAAIAGLLLLGAVLYAPYHFKNIDLSTYIVVWISIASVIITLTVPVLKERVKEKGGNSELYL